MEVSPNGKKFSRYSDFKKFFANPIKHLDNYRVQH